MSKKKKKDKAGNISVHTMEDTEIEGLTKILQREWSSTYGKMLGASFDAEVFAHFLDNVLLAAGTTALVATNNEKNVVGFIVLASYDSPLIQGGHVADASYTWIKPGETARSSLSALLDAAIDWAKSKDALFLTLLVPNGEHEKARNLLGKGCRLLESRYMKKV